jgi:hypothetical protein
MKKTLTAIAAGLLLAGSVAGTASADPNDELDLLLTCGGKPVTATLTPGKGTYAPAFDTGGTSVFVPAYFGETYFSESVGGIEVVGGTNPAEVPSKGRAKQSATRCTFESSYSYPNEAGDTVDGVFGGVVYIKTKV